jgi:hypothetical protein
LEPGTTETKVTQVVSAVGSVSCGFPRGYAAGRGVPLNQVKHNRS